MFSISFCSWETNIRNLNSLNRNFFVKSDIYIKHKDIKEIILTSSLRSFYTRHDKSSMSPFDSYPGVYYRVKNPEMSYFIRAAV